MTGFISQTNEQSPPRGWEFATLSKVLTQIKEPVNPTDKPQLPHVGFEHIEPGQITLIRWGKGSDVTSLQNSFRKNDVLYCKLNPRLDRAVVASIDGICSTDILVLRPSERVLPEFITLLLHTKKFRSLATSTTTGVSLSHARTSWNSIKDFCFFLPSLAEQSAIVAALSTIQSDQRVNRESLQIMREMRKSAMVHFFRDDLSSKISQSTESMSHASLAFPDNWRMTTIGAIFDIQQGKSLSPASRRGISPRPFLRTSNVFWGRINTKSIDRMDFTDEEVSLLALQAGDLLVCEGGDIGRTAIWEGQIQNCCYQNHLHRLRPKREDINPLFYMYWMDAATNIFGLYKGEGNKTTIPNLSKGRLSSFVVPLPPLAEQNRIANALKSLDRKIFVEEERMQCLEDLSQTILHLLIFGEVRLQESEALRVG